MKGKLLITLLCYLIYTFPIFSQTNKDRKGQIELMLSIPYVNNFYSHPDGESVKIGTGFWGVSGGVGYQYGSNRFVSLLGSLQIQYDIPVLMGIDYEDGIYEDQYSKNISLMDNYQINKWIFGYGLSYSWNSWRIRYFGEDYIPPYQVPYSVSNQSLGTNLYPYFNLFRHLYVGLVYRPQFLTVDPATKFQYSHSISLDFSWRWRINTMKK